MQPFREAFVICPISKKDSDTRKRSDLLMEKVISPILNGVYNCSVGRADYFYDDPDFTEIIHKRIAQADLIIADLTGLNPNVFYELGHSNMMGLPTILFIDSVNNLPSDIRQHKAIPYSLESLGKRETLEIIRAEFQGQVLGRKGFIPKPLPGEAVPRLIDRFKITSVEEVHTGRRDHYKMAANMISRSPKKALLMQRSSSLILGPEAQWGDEASFYETTWAAIESGLELYHIVSKEGIVRHLQRPQSTFPDIAVAHNRLTNVKGVVAIPATGNAKATLIKAIPETGIDIDLKPDRQARVLAAQFDDIYESIMVMDVGGQQVSMRIRGPEAEALFYTCMDFYFTCDMFLWKDMKTVTS